MTQLEQQQQKEIERLQRKIKSLTEAYSNTAKELNQIRQKSLARKKGRPAVNTQTRLRVLALCRKGYTMRMIGTQVGLSVGTVHKIIAQASRESRTVYIYMDREKPATIIDACALTQKVRIVNLSDDMLSRAFGVRENPTWEEYLEFLESRCMPRTRFGIREELHDMGIDSYDPLQILEKTEGRVYGDGQWLDHMSPDLTGQFDAIMKMAGKDLEKRRELLRMLENSKRQVMYDESEY